MTFFEIKNKNYAGAFFVRANEMTLADFLYIKKTYFNGRIFIEIFDEGVSLKIEECQISCYNTPENRN